MELPDMRTRLLAPLFALSLTSAVWAQSNPAMNSLKNLPDAANQAMHMTTPEQTKASQRLALSNYCRADFTGARLDPKAWSRI